HIVDGIRSLRHSREGRKRNSLLRSRIALKAFRQATYGKPSGRRERRRLRRQVDDDSKALNNARPPHGLKRVQCLHRLGRGRERVMVRNSRRDSSRLECKDQRRKAADKKTLPARGV